VSLPLKYGARLEIHGEIGLGFSGRAIVTFLDIPTKAEFFASRDEIRNCLIRKIDAALAELEGKLLALENAGVASPVEKLRRRGKR